MNAAFLSPLRTETIGERRWLLTDDLVFYSAIYRGVFIAPRGFQTDLASIPRIAWVLFPKVGKHDKGAVIHDGAYANALVTQDGDRIFAAKAVGDTLFNEGMRAEHVNGLTRRFMHRAVAIWGDPNGHPLANALPSTMQLRRQTI